MALPSTEKGFCILAGSAGEHLTDECCGLLGVAQTSCSHTRHNDGECHVSINENIRGRNVCVVQSTCHPADDNIVELSLLISAIRRASAERIVAVVPYYGYARQTRKHTSRVPISAADVATIFEEQGLDQIVTVDLHADQIAGFFSPRCSLDNLSILPAAARYFYRRGVRSPVIIAPHATGVARAKEFYEELQRAGAESAAAAPEGSAEGGGGAAAAPAANPTLAMLLTTRDPGAAHKRLELIGEVEGRDVVIIDDMIDTGGTIARGAAELKARGAAKVYAFGTHGLFTGSAFDTIAAADVELVVTTNSVHRVVTTLPMAHPVRRKLVVLSVAPIIAHHLSEIGGLPAPEVDPSTPIFSMHGIGFDPKKGSRRQGFVSQQPP